MAGPWGSQRKPCRVERIAVCIDRFGQADPRARATAVTRTVGARLFFAVGPQRVVHDADAPLRQNASWVRKLAIGVGRRNRPVAETAVPQFFVPRQGFDFRPSAGSRPRRPGDP